jgi:hypothetical protein
MSENQKYFCINCFEDENIRNIIKSKGRLVENKIYKCESCEHETCNKYDVQECIQQYIDTCVQKIEESVTEEEYENNEEAYLTQCEEECKQKYQQTCIDKLAEEIYIIEKDVLVAKIKEAIEKLYEHDDEHGLYDSASSKYYTEDIDCPCLIAGLKSTDEICGDIFGEDGEKITKLLNEYYGFHECPWLCKCFDNDEGNRFGKWSGFCENVKHKARYFDHEEFKVKEYLDKFIPFFEIVQTSSYISRVYRARIIHSETTKQEIIQDCKNKLGKVPEDKLKNTQNNRFSPIGISYGYYSFDEKTILQEVRVNINDEVAIGEFQLDSNLKILDFRNKSLLKYKNPFDDKFSIDVYCGEEFILDFLFDISKSISKSDTALEYVPTQILSEYIWSLEYHGFIFDSSQDKGRENLVLFGENPECINYKFIKIKEKNIDYIYEVTIE